MWGRWRSPSAAPGPGRSPSTRAPWARNSVLAASRTCCRPAPGPRVGRGHGRRGGPPTPGPATVAGQPERRHGGPDNKSPPTERLVRRGKGGGRPKPSGPAAQVPSHRPHRAGRPGAARSGCGSSASQAPTPPATPPPRAQRAPRPSRRWAGGRGAGGQSGSSPSAGPARPGHRDRPGGGGRGGPQGAGSTSTRRTPPAGTTSVTGHPRQSVALARSGALPADRVARQPPGHGAAPTHQSISGAGNYVEITSSRPRRPVISPRSGRAAP